MAAQSSEASGSSGEVHVLLIHVVSYLQVVQYRNL